jgi:hypothetical protein
MRTSPRGLPKKLNDLKFNELARPLSVHTLCICSLNRTRSRHRDRKAEKLDALDVSSFSERASAACLAPVSLSDIQPEFYFDFSWMRNLLELVQGSKFG